MFHTTFFTTIVFFVFSATVYSQISVSVMVSDSVRQVPMPFVNVIIERDNAPIAGGQTDLKGHYSFMVTETGKYQMKAKYMNSTCSTGVFDIRNDTIILLKMHRPLQYEAPCRQKVNDNEVIMDLPAEHYDNCEFRRIMTTTEKLGFDFLMDRTENTNIRIWTEPAFDYYGGKVTNVIETGNGWNIQHIFYRSNYFEYLDYLDNSDTEETDCSNCGYDFDVFQNMKFMITEVVDTSFLHFGHEKNLKQTIDNFFSTEDYCVAMLAGDRHPCTDGVTYHLEIKSGNQYKFITFENPDCIDLNLSQIRLFLELLQCINDI